jgi:regulator of protease activity HflC (stomatin/prohibitin superfamily)
VQTGLQTLEIDKQFFPRLSDQEEKMLVDKDKGASALAGGADSLDPDADGHLLTADGNIAHARWSVTYQRSDAGRNAANIDPDSERQIVAAAAARGVVRAAASLTIDDLLRKQVDTSQSSVSSSRIESLAREAAQSALDQIESGIQITDLTMTVAIPPRFVMASFDKVSGAQSQAGKLVETARTERNDKLTQAAGEAAAVLLDLIDDYEAELARIQQGAGDPAKAAAALDNIDRVLQREEAVVDGQRVRVRVSGKVSQIIDDARQYRTSVVNLASGDYQVFKAKKELFDSNPLVMITSDWTEAFTGVLSNEAVQAIYLPEDVARLVLIINRDPRIVRSLEELANRREAEAAQQQRILERDRKRFTDRMDSQSRQRVE